MKNRKQKHNLKKKNGIAFLSYRILDEQRYTLRIEN